MFREDNNPVFPAHETPASKLAATVMRPAPKPLAMDDYASVKIDHKASLNFRDYQQIRVVGLLRGDRTHQVLGGWNEWAQPAQDTRACDVARRIGIGQLEVPVHEDFIAAFRSLEDGKPTLMLGYVMVLATEKKWLKDDLNALFDANSAATHPSLQRSDVKLLTHWAYSRKLLTI